MARNPRQRDVTAENVDNLSDEEVTALMNEGEPDEPGEDAGEQAEQASDPDEGVSRADDAKVADGDGEKPAEGEQEPPPENEEGREGDDGKSETVDFKRYDYERNRRRDAEKARDAERAEWARRFDELLNARQQPPAPEEQAPEVPGEDDPLGRLNYVFDRLQQNEQETAEQTHQREAAEQQQTYARTAIGEANAEFQRAAQADPSLNDAYEALKASLAAELAVTTPQHELQARLNQVEAQHILWAKQNHVPVDEYVRQLATSRGWTPKPDDPPGSDNGATGAAKQVQGRKRAKTLSNSGGSPGVGDTLTAEQILAMSDSEFDALIEKNGSVSEYLERHG